MAFAIAGLTNAPVLPLSLDLCIETYVSRERNSHQTLLYFLQNSSSSRSNCRRPFSRRRVRLFIHLSINIFFSSQLGSILSISVLPYFTQDPTAHQRSIQKCEVKDGKIDDIRDYSGN